MTTIFEVATTNYEDSILNAKKAMSHLQTNCGVQNGFAFGKPSSKFGWTFFQMSLKTDLYQGIEQKFSDIIQKYKDNKQEVKFTKFLSDFLESRNCKVKLKILEN